jgi:hypothetical protein
MTEFDLLLASYILQIFKITRNGCAKDKRCPKQFFFVLFFGTNLLGKKPTH